MVSLTVADGVDRTPLKKSASADATAEKIKSKSRTLWKGVI